MELLAGNKQTAMMLLLLAAAAAAEVGPEAGCRRRLFGPAEERNIVCECRLGAAGCDRLELALPPPAGLYLRVDSNWEGLRWATRLVALATPGTGAPHNGTGDHDYLVEVEANRRLQRVAGYGGAFTDSAALALRSLPAPLEQRLLEDYFGPQGLDYNLGRVPVAGTDMSTRAYSYDELGAEEAKEEDPQLEHFRLQPEDLELRLPLIRRVNQMRASRGLGPLGLMAASWSAPSWMKSNRHLVQGQLRAEFYPAYARYLVRFLDEYARENVSFWALSPQNEPHTPKRVGPAKINFNSLNFEPQQMADFLEKNLIPELLNSGRTSDKLALYLWDDTTDGLERYAEACLARPLVRDHARGLALHWYSSGLRGAGYDWLQRVRALLPARYSLLSTEASFIGRPQPGAWWRGQRYARDLLEHLRAGSLAWLDWNLALNSSGGPSWSHNLLDAAVLVEADQELYYRNPMFYALAHVTRFVPAHSHVLASSARPQSPRAQREAALSVVAAEMGPSLLGLVVQNRARGPRSLRLRLAGCGEPELLGPPLTLRLTADSLTSLAIRCRSE